MPPQGLTREEQDYWNRMEGIVNGLLDELKAGGWVKRENEFDRPAFGQLLQIAGRVEGHFETWNALNQLFQTKRAELSNFLVLQKVGFTDDNVGNLWLYDALSAFIETTELFRDYLLVILRQKAPFDRDILTLGQLMGALIKASPTFGKKLADEVDVDLRNAVAHTLYWMSKKDPNAPPDISYCGKLGEVPVTNSLSEVMVRVRKHNLLGGCLAELLSTKATSNWFK